MGAPALKLPDDDSSIIEGDPTTEEERREMDAFWAMVDPVGHDLLMGNTMKGAFGRLNPTGAMEAHQIGLRKRDGRWSDFQGNPLLPPSYGKPIFSTWLKTRKK